MPKKKGEKTSAAPTGPTTNAPSTQEPAPRPTTTAAGLVPVDVDCLQTLQDWENSWPKRTPLSLDSMNRLKKVALPDGLSEGIRNLMESPSTHSGGFLVCSLT
jgi:hypothetical protein